MNNLPKVATRQHGGWGSNSRPLSHQFNDLVTRLSSHTGSKDDKYNNNSLSMVCCV